MGPPVLVAIGAQPVAAGLEDDVRRFESLDAAAAATGRSPLVLVDPDVTSVSAGAVERLAQAAAQDTTVATVCALRLAADLPPAASPARPAVAAPLAGLVLVTRPALDLVLPLDGAGLDELARRASALGLVHLLADDVAAAPAAAEPDVEAPRHALERAVLAVTTPGRRLSVTIDGRVIGPYRAGTQVHALELIAALARTDALDIRVVVAPDLAAAARELFEQHPRISTVGYEEAAGGGLASTDVAYRPSQAFAQADLDLLAPLGRRLVVWHLDLIAFRSAALNAEPEVWRALRRVTQLSLAAADHVVFSTDAARRDALRDDFVDADRATVVGLGVDHRVVPQAAPAAPAGFDATHPYLLALGADLPHKNLPFARRLAAALDLRLVCAGPGTELGQVSEAEKAFLVARAAAVVYPTLYEGFGLIPFEAGAAGVPCLFAPVSALAETLPAELATLVPWDVEASARAARPLLTPGPERDAHVEGLRRAAAPFTWDAAAAQLVDVYRRTLEQPVTYHAADPGALLAAARDLDRLGHRYGLLEGEFLRYQETIGRDGWALVGEHGLLTPQDRRALLAVLTRPALRGPFQRLLRLGYRAGRRGS